VGQSVEVAIESPASGLIAHFAGTLTQGHELAPGDEPGPVFFSFDDGGSGFVIDPRGFASATRIADGSMVRFQDLAGVAVIVERESDPARGG
jgi:hypothetical protein